jgi:hypothetical protein
MSQKMTVFLSNIKRSGDMYIYICEIFPLHIISILILLRTTKYDEDVFDDSISFDFIGKFYKW